MAAATGCSSVGVSSAPSVVSLVSTTGSGSSSTTKSRISTVGSKILFFYATTLHAIGNLLAAFLKASFE